MAVGERAEAKNLGGRKWVGDLGSLNALSAHISLIYTDEDSNGAIDQEELKKCFLKLEIKFTEEETNDLFEACDINEDMGMKFKEFIVLLCLVYLLKDDPTALHAKSRMGMPKLEATFETLVDAFVFLDKNKDEEMDWDKNGMVNFKEFLFAFTNWVGIDDEEEGEEKV
ncbi:hypothetical protein Pint_03621 [Pistacia integerrima]|uniref:Uncharacterized protein n=1 Tax=Pistacia integerrima TaxID=434235 RepID=A0ACC0Z9R6_9ROSI|nr:hypothetical protein Pint_03621 [Pistacia integerrima]